MKVKKYLVGYLILLSGCATNQKLITVDKVKSRFTPGTKKKNVLMSISLIIKEALRVKKIRSAKGLGLQC